MRFGWMGVHVEGVPALKALLSRGKLEVVLTLTPEAAAKRSGASDYCKIMHECDVPFYEIEHINAYKTMELLRELSLDVLFVIGWSQIIAPDTLAIPRMGMVGAHASLLPHNRGSAPVNWVLINGETQTGNSLLWLTPDVDGGDVIEQTVIPITQYDTCATLYEKVAESNLDMLLRLVARIEAGERPGRRQSHLVGPLLQRRRPKDGLIDWDRPSTEVYNFIRALTRPYPGAFTYMDDECWWVWGAALLPDIAIRGTVPGDVLGSVVSPNEEACGQLVACHTGAVMLLEIESKARGIVKGRSLSDLRWTGRQFSHGQENTCDSVTS
jgi:methionyl-tRNA formyltransferase